MTSMAGDSVQSIPDRNSRASTSSRDFAIDTMRGFAILMVIGIHSLALGLIAGLRQFGPAANFAITYAVIASVSIVALLAVREFAPPRIVRWLGA